MKISNRSVRASCLLSIATDEYHHICYINFKRSIVESISIFIPLFTQLYVGICIIFICEKYLQYFHNAGEAWANKTSLTHHFLLKCPLQARRVRDHVHNVLFVVITIQSPLSPSSLAIVFLARAIRLLQLEEQWRLFQEHQSSIVFALSP
jgi:hypothetical protein